jgi:hypothetical protein
VPLASRITPIIAQEVMAVTTTLQRKTNPAVAVKIPVTRIVPPLPSKGGGFEFTLSILRMGAMSYFILAAGSMARGFCGTVPH